MLDHHRKAFRRCSKTLILAASVPLMIGLSGCLNGLGGGGSSANNNGGSGGAGSNKPADQCAPDTLTPVAGATGTAEVFFPDPMIRAGSSTLAPNSSQLDSFRTPVPLANLGGHAVLEGRYVDVRNGLNCDNWFGAYDKTNNFVYDHANFRFQEAMSYYFGDQFRSTLDANGVLLPNKAVKIIAHCMQDDNAFYGRTSTGEGKVCLGDSVQTPGASYADDAVVVIHELQHATTIDSYTPPNSQHPALNQFWYDEAGALNEAISDFMALIRTAPILPSPFDPRVFSRWALGTFIPGHSGVRGAHRCPIYDPSYPNCGSFPSFSAANNTISYVYPDGLGWPYPNNYAGPGYASSAFLNYKGQEEIHNAGVLMAGALWDVYEALRGTHGGDSAAAESISQKLVMNALRNLPQPSLTSLSPVSFRGFASKMLEVASQLGLSQQDQSAVSQALTARGLVGGPSLDSTWAAVGPGKSVTPGLRVEDNPTLLKSWLYKMGGDSSAITQGIATGTNAMADPGEVVALWFDLQNDSQYSAGGIQLTITSSDPDVTFLDGGANIGPISQQQAQINYGKIYGTNAVAALTSTNPTFHVPASNSYFGTNPFYGKDWTTAVWARISPTTAHGKSVTLQVKALPSNGEASTTNFTLVVH